MSSILMMRIKIVDRSVRAERYGDRFLFFPFSRASVMLTSSL